MTKQEIILKVKTLGWPRGSYIVFGSCPLAAAGIREANDIDFLVSKELFDSLRKEGWVEVQKGPGDKPLKYDIFEVHESWNFSSYKPTLEQLLASADVFNGVPFASLAEVRNWKIASNRPKDLTDIELIDKHLRRLTLGPKKT